MTRLYRQVLAFVGTLLARTGQQIFRDVLGWLSTEQTLWLRNQLEIALSHRRIRNSENRTDRPHRQDCNLGTCSSETGDYQQSDASLGTSDPQSSRTQDGIQSVHISPPTKRDIQHEQIQEPQSKRFAISLDSSKVGSMHCLAGRDLTQDEFEVWDRKREEY